MAFDPATQAIARFIGLFELAIEEFRLRQDYLEFRMKRPAQDDVAPLEGVSVKLQAPYELGKYDPGLSYDHPAAGIPPLPIPRIAIDGGIELPGVLGIEALIWEISPPHVPSQIIYLTPQPFSFLLAAPGSIVSVTVQVIVVSDNDLFISGLGTNFTDPAVLEETLAEIVALADTLAGFQAPDLPQDGDWMSFAEGVLDQFDNSAPTVDGAVIIAFRGTETEGVIVDGEVAEEAPDWADLLPWYLKPEDIETDEIMDENDDPSDTEAEGENVAQSNVGTGQNDAPAQTGQHDFSLDFGDDAPDPYDGGAENEIVAGANLAINEIAVGSKWVDAPVIVVSGDMARFDAISQVNVLVEHDRIDGAAIAQASTGHNITEIIEESSLDPEEQAPSQDILPSDWQVVTIEADLIQVNWVKQFTHVTDFDRAEVNVTGQTIYLGLGGNEMVNTTILNEFGYNFDLIFVGGNMIDATVVSQKNVLYDSDTLATREPGAPVAEEGALEYPAIASIESDITVEDAALETISTGDISEDVPDIPETPFEPPTLSLADNLLFNKTTLKTTGVDKFVEMTENFATTAEELANGAETIAHETAQDALFAGKDALRVLKIEGDLAKINLFEQTNIVGDSDQVRLEMAAMRDKFDAQMKVVAGSNALVNVASITELGVDSDIMVGGQIYDDAFIHQAELFDTDAIPTGVALTGLANEAVAAFLADNVQNTGDYTDEITPISNYEGTSQLDVMQTALI